MFEFQNHGTIFLIYPRDEAAKAHADEVYQGAMRHGEAIAVEHRFAEENAAQLLDDGFRVFLDGRELALPETDGG